MGLWVVTGPPASGKSTWVRNQAKPGDIVIDYDLLATALTAPGAVSHDHRKTLRHITSRARAAAITEALKHTDRVDVYVIHSQPSTEAVRRYTEHQTDLHLIVVDPGRDVVMRRIAEQRPPQMRAVAERWYSNAHHTEQPALRSSRRW
ncbi:hypothetical protein C1I98_13310 [Spongiactinospora gelatinilytica]|uniref:AAA domain-containing protein n=1 Tax=Spongiactinospora gelatinilytica TaxID=2666298 RepID=A0A2W2GCN1_9ACTN|nr:AAA family ATPase [Spongiactinospora gelatinilytica]PZG47446.1 hypothetical protein C1I98_13310 [Spongiactinospora gelatinilytica]